MATDRPMPVGLIGLGRMGADLACGLSRDGLLDGCTVIEGAALSAIRGEFGGHAERPE
ncbi:hypothetical protein ABGB18_03450 [Nonomuraea sp. B12E4]|uniref:hypothetical protein n=1 Tax=Nonomuraea sp. B12E4 TaxID=3153564 RepID=UPI00325D22AD